MKERKNFGYMMYRNSFMLKLSKNPLSIFIWLVVMCLCSTAFADECILLSDIEKWSSQGYIAPIIKQYENGGVIIDNRGMLHYYNKLWQKSQTLDLWSNRTKIDRMNVSSNNGVVDNVSINNMLYTVVEEQIGDRYESRVEWKREFNSPVRGSSNRLNNRLAVLTIDNYLHVLDSKDGDVLWTYSHGSNRVIGLYEVIGSYAISPIITHNMIITPFSNGELVAFNHNGQKLWSYKFSADLIYSAITDIITTPQLRGDTLLAANKSYIAAIDIKSGSLLWSQPMRIKNISKQEIDVIVITEDSKAVKIEPSTGQVIWSTQLPLGSNTASTCYDDLLSITSDSGVMFILDKHSGDIKKRLSIPKNVYHNIASNDNVLFTTEKRGVYTCSYDEL